MILNRKCEVSKLLLMFFVFLLSQKHSHGSLWEFEKVVETLAHWPISCCHNIILWFSQTCTLVSVFFHLNKQFMFAISYMGYSRKIHTPPMDGKLEILMGETLMAWEISLVGGSEPKNSSSGVTFTFNLGSICFNHLKELQWKILSL